MAAARIPPAPSSDACEIIPYAVWTQQDWAAGVTLSGTVADETTLRTIEASQVNVYEWPGEPTGYNGLSGSRGRFEVFAQGKPFQTDMGLQVCT